MALKHRPFESLIPKWEEERKSSESERASERPTIPVEKESIQIFEANSFESLPDDEGSIESRLEQTLLGRVDAVTSIGGPRSRYDHNEDGFAIRSLEDELAIMLVDGAGGSGNGKLAAMLASEAFLEAMRQGEDLVGAFEQVSENIQSRARGGYATGVAIHARKIGEKIRVNLAAVGDSKVITIRSGERFGPGTTAFQNLAQIALDTRQIEPWEYYNHPNLGTLTAALGAEKVSIPPQFKMFEHQEGDVSIIGSDGLWDVVSEHEILQFAAQFKGRELQQKIFELAYMRNNQDYFDIRHSASHVVLKESYKGGDNITVIVVG